MPNTVRANKLTRQNTKYNLTRNKTKKTLNNKKPKYKLLTLQELKLVSQDGSKPVSLIFMMDGDKSIEKPLQYKFTGSLIKKTMNNFLTDIVKTEVKKDWLKNNSILYSKPPIDTNRTYFYLEAYLDKTRVELEIYYKDGQNVLGDSMSKGLYYHL